MRIVLIVLGVGAIVSLCLGFAFNLMGESFLDIAHKALGG